MNRRNYQKELDELLASFSEKKRLFLHCCCAPCSSYVLEYLHDFFDITVFFYNPNISEASEYQKRKEELKRFLQTAPFGKEIHMQDADYEPELFEKMAKGHENDPERGPRCAKCFRLRLEETAKYAKEGTYDYFCTTLSISPHKNADLLMQIGEELSKNYGVYYLPSDFKKKNGYTICTGRIFVAVVFQKRKRRTCDASKTMDFSFPVCHHSSSRMCSF